MKSIEIPCNDGRFLSLPSRERGLKSLFFCLYKMLYLSLPSRERGLKFSEEETMSPDALVAPFAGAWIEIFALAIAFNAPSVAPFAGAWIEIRKY